MYANAFPLIYGQGEIVPASIILHTLKQKASIFSQRLPSDFPCRHSDFPSAGLFVPMDVLKGFSQGLWWCHTGLYPSHHCLVYPNTGWIQFHGMKTADAKRCNHWAFSENISLQCWNVCGLFPTTPVINQGTSNEPLTGFLCVLVVDVCLFGHSLVEAFLLLYSRLKSNVLHLWVSKLSGVHERSAPPSSVLQMLVCYLPDQLLMFQESQDLCPAPSVIWNLNEHGWHIRGHRKMINH